MCTPCHKIGSLALSDERDPPSRLRSVLPAPVVCVTSNCHSWIMPCPHPAQHARTPHTRDRPTGPTDRRTAETERRHALRTPPHEASIRSCRFYASRVNCSSIASSALFLSLEREAPSSSLSCSKSNGVQGDWTRSSLSNAPASMSSATGASHPCGRGGRAGVGISLLRRESCR